MIMQLEDGAVALLSKAIEDEGLEICTEGIQKHKTIDEYVQAWRILDTWGGSKEKRPPRRLRHLRSIGILTLLSSGSSSGMFAMDYPVLSQIFPT
jgi:hypothetical protein